MTEKIPLRLCIVSSLRIDDFSQIQSFEISQVKSFGEEIEMEVSL